MGEMQRGFSLLCDRKLLLNFKRILSHHCKICKLMLCGTQYWGVKIQQKKLGVLLMRMLQWTSGHLRHDMIRAMNALKRKFG